MLLAIDAGNSNITLGLFSNEELVVQWRLETEHEKSSDEYGAAVRKVFSSAGIDLKEVRGVVIASVVPPLNQTLQQMVQVNFQLMPLFVDHENAGLKIQYDQPSDLGADRIVDAVAAIAKYGAPCIVVDFGTATTFNAINASGEFIGGAISPGLQTCADALFVRTAKLPRVEFVRPEKVIATSTIGAIQSGLYHGYAGLVDGILKQMLEAMGGSARVIATGGLAPLIGGASQHIELVDQTLTLDGLRLVYERISADKVRT
jgi:type III pantothenate kinase